MADNMFQLTIDQTQDCFYCKSLSLLLESLQQVLLFLIMIILGDGGYRGTG